MLAARTNLRSSYAFALSVLISALVYVAPTAASAASLSGQVVRGDGSPVSSVDVAVRTQDGLMTVATGTTGLAGAYQMNAVPSGTYDVRFTPPVGLGLSTRTIQDLVIAGDETLDVLLAAASPVVFSGTVRDRDGVVVSGISVELCDETGNYRSEVTGVDGRFSFSRAPGSYCWRIGGGQSNSLTLPTGFHLDSTTSLDLEDDVDLDISIPTVAVTVRVQDPDGAPVAGAGVNLHAAGSGPTVTIAPGIQATTYAEDSATTDVSGVAVLALFGTTNATGSVTSPTPSLADVAIHGQPIDGSTTIDVALVEPVMFSGVLLDRDGDPASGISVEVCDETGNYRSEVTDADGRFSFSRAPGSYCWRIAGGQTNSLKLPTGMHLQVTTLDLSDDVDLEITIPTVAVTVNVVDPDGDPVAGSTASLHSTTGSTVTIAPGFQATGSIEDSALTDASGVAVLALFDTANVIGSVTSPSPDLIGVAIPSQPVDGPTTIDVALVEPVVFSGTVRDRAGDPVAGISVEVCDATGNYRSETTGSDGRFAFQRAPGSYCWRIAGGQTNSLLLPVGLHLDPTTPLDLEDDIDLDISIPTVPVTVRVQDPEGAPVAGAGVNLHTSYPAGPMVVIAPGIQAATYAEDSATTDVSGVAVLALFGTTNATGSVTSPTPSLADVAIPGRPINGPTTIFIALLSTDHTAPSIAVTSPQQGAVYTRDATVLADYSCTDESEGSGIESCNGTVVNGQAIDASTIGAHSFTVTASDHAGNTATEVVNYEVVSPPAVKDYADVVRVDAPVAYWRLGDAGDTSSMSDDVGSYPGEYKNGAGGSLQQGISGDGNTVAVFAGNGTYGYVNGMSAPRRKYTMEAWVYADDTGDAMIMQHGGAGALFIAGGHYAFRQVDVTVAAAVGPQIGHFDHVVGTWDGFTARIYINGYLSGSSASSKAPSGSATFYIGYGDLAPWFRGYLDEAAYYDHALTADRVLAHFEADPPPPLWIPRGLLGATGADSSITAAGPMLTATARPALMATAGPKSRTRAKAKAKARAKAMKKAKARAKTRAKAKAKARAKAKAKARARAKRL